MSEKSDQKAESGVTQAPLTAEEPIDSLFMKELDETGRKFRQLLQLLHPSREQTNFEELLRLERLQSIVAVQFLMLSRKERGLTDFEIDAYAEILFEAAEFLYVVIESDARKIERLEHELRKATERRARK